MPAVSAMAKAPQKVTRTVAFTTFAPPALAPIAPSKERNSSDAAETSGTSWFAGASHTHGEWHHRTDSKSQSRRQGGNDRPCGGNFGNTELVACMRFERVLLHQLLGDASGQGDIDPALDIELRQFPHQAPRWDHFCVTNFGPAHGPQAGQNRRPAPPLSRRHDATR